ncbi:putative SNF2 family helicase/ATPase [Aspergillus alliaceus]|uniref:putative SNF2 family helicase/ATPase n=1 Tax=Petromyces alliaceus TaxID=209559 RepID=UPI0012A4BD95|nr:SNF2 family N-terminal domain-containing protein [Aspergillus alliaceus]KAB8227514.1 SNF2 family N-terminal domain-containing protein [Aspergillus alliaceus]
MAKESENPLNQTTPRKPNEQPHRHISQQPEFGKPSPLGAGHPQNRQSNHPFNIPKQNRPRPEHHRPHPQQRPGAPFHGHRPPATPGGAISTPKRGEPFDPFKPVRPSAYNDSRFSRPVNDDVVEIKRPENFTFNTPRAPKTFFASKPSAIKMTNASKNLRNFVDLTGEGSFTPGSRPRNVGFGSMDVNGYVDTAKANENIKALLEGAFEDEDEKQHPKTKNKKNKSKKNKGKNKKAENQKEEKKDSSDIDDLAAQLQEVTVNESSADGSDADNVEIKVVQSSEKSTHTTATGEHSEHDVTGDIGSENDDDDEEEEDEDDGTVEGLKVKLLPHQREGVNWMRDKEIGNSKNKGVLPKGGILADDMGLGKTVQAITLMLTNRKPKDGRRRIVDEDECINTPEAERDNDDLRLPPGLSKSTLVVAPLALIKQWESEILDKVETSHKLRVCVYHGNTRTKAGDNLGDYDVVITTYGTLTSEHGAIDKSNKKSGIFSVYWYRIILDEAHTIKNRNAKATQSACALDAEYRWCLTGTPMQNNLDELQSLIKFLRIKPYNDLAAWKEQITKPLANGRGALAIERLQVVLKAFMKRRTKDVLKLNNNLKPKDVASGGEQKKSPGFHIVKREVIKVSAEFTPGELNFYKRLEQRTDNSLEKMMGGSKLDYAGALVLLLRLRQSCNHPDLVKSDLAKDKDILLQNGTSGSQPAAGKQDDLDSMADLFGALSVVSKKCDICQAELSQKEAKGGASRCDECETDLNINFAGSQSRKEYSSKEDVVDLTRSPSNRRSEVQHARSRKNRKIVMDSDDDEDDGEWIVPEDQRTVPDLGKAGGSDDEDAEGGGRWLGSDDSETDSDDEAVPESPTRNRIGGRKQNSESDEDDIYLNPSDGDNQLLPSTKVRHLMRILRRESADHKFIVFSVFTSMLDKIEPFLQRTGIGFARYDGGMRNDLREASLNRLRNNSATRVLLCSLRAGALGLNLTAASRVVILEPFWNPFVEEQAIDRVHRLNQTVDVKIYKLIVKDTVEERIIDLQERKRELANVTIEGKTAAAKLTMNDMMALFGRDAESRFTGERGNIDLVQSTRLLSSADENNCSGSQSFERPTAQTSHSRSRDRNRQPEKRAVPRAEDSVFGRRW